MALLVGIRVRLLKTVAFVIAGVLAALAGSLQLGLSGIGSLRSAPTFCCRPSPPSSSDRQPCVLGVLQRLGDDSGHHPARGGLLGAELGGRAVLDGARLRRSRPDRRRAPVAMECHIFQDEKG